MSHYWSLYWVVERNTLDGWVKIPGMFRSLREAQSALDRWHQQHPDHKYLRTQLRP